MTGRPKGQLEMVPMPRKDVEHILDSFTVLRANEEAATGEFKTKAGILREFDSMDEAVRSGRPYVSRLDPPPGDPRAAHQPRATDCRRCTKSKACCSDFCHRCAPFHGKQSSETQ